MIAVIDLLGEIHTDAPAHVQLGPGFHRRHQHDTIDDDRDDEKGDDHRQETANKELE